MSDEWFLLRDIQRVLERADNSCDIDLSVKSLNNIQKARLERTKVSRRMQELRNRNQEFNENDG